MTQWNASGARAVDTTPRIDPRLMDSISEGNCVAFVGAGFSAAAGLPSWNDLLQRVSKDMPQGTAPAKQQLLRSLIGKTPMPSSRDLEMAAQILHDAYGDTFRARLAKEFEGRPLQPAMMQRLKHLRGIPFRAIVTTNFDTLIRGMPPKSDAYRRLLRSRRPSPWRDTVARAVLDLDGADADDLCDDVPIVQLHGRLDDADTLVLTRSQYRRRLYADPAYLTVLRSLLATNTVLFLGYSLTDAYLNELRSELVEAFSGGGSRCDPLAWAVLADVSDEAIRYYEEYEGLGVLSYPSGIIGQEHDGFDRILKTIYSQTNPLHRLGQLLANRHVLWFDPHPDHNDVGRTLLTRAHEESQAETPIRLKNVSRLEELRQDLSASAQLDLIISHWGHGMGPAGRANGEELLCHLAELRAQRRPSAPVVIFAAPGAFEAENRRRALELGAAEYVSRWGDLMVAIERILGAGPHEPPLF